MKNNFAYFIACYGDSKNIPTLKALQAKNAKYPIYLVVGDDDPDLENYLKLSNVLIFKKSDYYGKVDELGEYSKTHKICTYSRPAIEDFAKKLNIEYIGYMFNDIIGFTLRYRKDNGVSSTANFKIDEIIDMYIELLNSSDNIYAVGPPASSFYIGVNIDKCREYTNRWMNMYIYKLDKNPPLYKANVIEDLDLMMRCNSRGKLVICPFGLHANCRQAMVSEDAYGSMKLSEYLQQKSIVASIDIGKSVRDTKIPYSKNQPKIIDEKFKKCNNYKKKTLF